MTDIISNNNKGLIQQKPHRRVKLQNNKNTTMNTTATSFPVFVTNNDDIPALKSSLKKKHSSNKPTTSKSVHFDIQLEYIQHFHSPPPIDDDDIITLEIMDCKDALLVNEDDDDDAKEDEENKLEDEFLELFWNNKFQNNYSISSPTKVEAPTRHCHSYYNKQHGTISLLNWPSDVHPTRRFISQMVSLESIVWDTTKSVAQGRVLVHNISYEKKVTVRYTLDNWATWSNIEAVYKETAFENSGINNSALDRFEFYLSIPESTVCSLAVRYEPFYSNGQRQEFWDNNGQKNFSIKLTYSPTLTEQGVYYDHQITHDNKAALCLPSRLHELYLAAARIATNKEQQQNEQQSFFKPTTTTAITTGATLEHRKIAKPDIHHDVLLIKNFTPSYLSI